MTSPTFNAAEIAAALMKAPATCHGLAKILGFGLNNASLAQRWVDQFHASGCVRIVGVSPRGARVYRWQSSLFAEPDCFDPFITKERNV
jgi:hypothetical protein